MFSLLCLFSWGRPGNGRNETPGASSEKPRNNRSILFLGGEVFLKQGPG